ncbi:MAG: hypothetical protein PHX18_03220 [Candidatus Gastranaerophilales bacterium]|nr:hypothetical protein [Candidatus Gastranaerophilales bacterium]
MKISQPIDILKYNKQAKSDNNETTFKNAALLTAPFIAINRHELIGLAAIDVTSMGLPRTIIDFTRNTYAGMETAFREFSSTLNLSWIGLSGLLTAGLLAIPIKKKYDVDFKVITADSDTVDTFAKAFHKIVNKNPAASQKELAEELLNTVFADVKGWAGNSKMSTSVLHSLSCENKNAIVKTLLQEIENNKKFALKGDVAYKLLAQMNFDIPSTGNLIAKIDGKELMAEGKYFINDAYSLTKAFIQKNVVEQFAGSADTASNKFLKSFSKLAVGKTILGLTLISGIGFSIQKFNTYMTKKRTGVSGFVGDPNYKAQSANVSNDNKTQEKQKSILPHKLVTASVIGFFVFKTIGPKNPGDFLKKIQFKSYLPTLDQIKVVYGTTIIGRLLAARNKDEVRETAFRDFLGFTNFLLLGALVTKLYVNWKDKSLINYDEKVHGKGFLNWIKNSSIKSPEEIINSGLKHNVIQDNKLLPVKQLFKNNWIKPEGEIAKRLSVTNTSKLIGLLYSCIALGIAVPLINKWITNRKTAAKSAVTIAEVQPSQETKNKAVSEFLKASFK